MNQFSSLAIRQAYAAFTLICLVVSIGTMGCEQSAGKKQPVPPSNDSQSPELSASDSHGGTDAKKSDEAVPSLPNISDEDFLNAALNGDASTVKRGIRQGIRVDAAAEDKRTALMLAAFNGHASIVKYLLEHEAKVDAVDAIQRTPLMFAATGPFAETVQLLIDAGANVNAVDGQENWTPLMMAAAEGHADVVALLLKHGALANLRDVDGDSALEFAANKGHQAVVELLSK